MTDDQIASVALILGSLLLFAWGRFRHDLVALVVLLGAVYLGLVKVDDAFAGFGHPAVVTVAAVLILGHAITASGLVDRLAKRCVPQDSSVGLQIAVLSGIGAFVSAFMNNVGALALLMPVAISAARAAKHSPSLVLLPLSVATMLGGLLTLIGTPSNLVVSGYRRDLLGEPFGFFDITPLGLVLVLLALAYTVLGGWRLIPARKPPEAEELFGIASYVTEASVPEKSTAIGKSFGEIDEAVRDSEARLFGLTRGKQRIPATAWWERVQAGDVLIFEAAPAAFPTVVEKLELELLAEQETPTEAIAGEGRMLLEAVVRPHALIDGLTAEEMRLGSRYGITLVAVSRQGAVPSHRLKSFRFTIGDVLLLQGTPAALTGALSALGLLPLAQRDLPLKRRRALPAVGLFALAVLAICFDLAAPAVALMTAVAGVLVLRSLSLREAYEAIDWSVIVLLGAMMPVGSTLETTGATQVIADWLLSFGQQVDPWMILALVLVATMVISDVANNAATAVMMAPLAIGLARGLGVSADPFLMAVAVGATVALLTPIGHQNNTLVMGPGGYRFGDYWRFGLPLELMTAVITVPLLLLLYPLTPA